MSARKEPRGTTVVARTLLMLLSVSGWLAAPTTSASAAGIGAGNTTSSPQDEVGSDPIACWWATDKTSVQVGERFTITLTCGVIEAGRVKVVADLGQLEPAAVSLAPFEVIGGARFRDIESQPWRYTQFTYTLRIIGDAYFGKDVDIPGLKVSYRIHSSIGGGSEGRDQTYLLPALPIRVMSLVPKKAGDIRDGSHETFGAIESRRFRATVEFVAASIFFGFGLVTLGLAGVRVWNRSRALAGQADPPLPATTVLRGCASALRRLKSDVAREGWSADLVARAVALFRIAGALAAGSSVSQTVVATRVAGREGQLVLRRGLFRPKHALVSAPMTPKVLGRRVDEAKAGVGASARLAQVQSVLAVFSTARYSRNGRLDTQALDRALEEGTTVIRRLRMTARWPVRTATRLAKSAADLKEAWSR